MTLPSILIGFLIASLFGTAFHLWRGGNLGRLIIYLISAWIGFWVGHMIGNYYGLEFLSLGPLRLGTAILGSAFSLLIGYWLSMRAS